MMRVIIENDKGKREFSSTLEAFAYEQAEFMMSENNAEADDAEKFKEMLAEALNNYLISNEKAFNYDELSNIYEEVYEEYKKSTQEEDVYLDDFRGDIEDWIIDALHDAGMDTAKMVLRAPREILLESADLEEEKIDEILSILASEFAEEEEFQHFLR